VPLQQNTFLVGDQFTVADIGFMPYLGYLAGTPAQATLEQHPHVLAWWKRLSERPSWRKVSVG